MPDHTPKEDREAYADMLVRLAEEVRSGATRIAHIEQHRVLHRYYLDGGWEYFTGAPRELHLTYYNVAHAEAENIKESEFVKNNPTAALIEDTEHTCSSCGKMRMRIPAQRL